MLKIFIEEAATSKIKYSAKYVEVASEQILFWGNLGKAFAPGPRWMVIR